MRYINLCLIAIMSLVSVNATAQTFTYQGFLKDGSMPAGNEYDFQFRLWTAATEGTQVGPTVEINDLLVSEGLFTVPLDFGNVWNGSDRFLEISVRVGSSTESYETLSPRIKVTPTPMAHFAFNVPWSGILGMPSGFQDGVDNDTLYSAGSGLQLSGTTFSIAAGGVQTEMLANEAVTTGKIGDLQVTDSKIANVRWSKIIDSPASFPPSGPAGGDLSGSYPNPNVVKLRGRALAAADPAVGEVLKWNGDAWEPAPDLFTAYEAGIGLVRIGAVFHLNTDFTDLRYVNEGQPNSINGAMIVDGSVNTADLADNAVTTAKIAPLAVDSININFQAVGELELKNNGVTTAKIANNAVTTVKIADNAVTTDKIANNAVTTDKIANNAVTTAKIANNAVTTAKIAEDAVTTTKIANGAVTTTKLENNAVITAKIADNNVTSAKLAWPLSVERAFNGFAVLDVRNTSAVANSMAIFGYCTDATNGTVFAIKGRTDSSNSTAVFGEATSAGGTTFGIRGINHSTSGRGVFGSIVPAAGTNYGVRGDSNSTNGYGVFGNKPAGGTGHAVFASGTLSASGTKSFQIDHPLDPANYYLLHYCTEAPEPLNAYSGNVITDAKGFATVHLPDYFESINRDFRYQLTVIGEFAQAIIAEKIKNNRFVIRTDKPNVEVSWRVEAVRNDLWMQRYGAPVEKEKPEDQKGKYQHPELYGQPKERGIHYQPDIDEASSKPN